MQSLNGTKVLVFRMHSSFHITDLGQLGPGAVTSSLRMHGDLRLSYHDGGVLIQGKGAKGTPFLAYVSPGNITGMELDLNTKIAPPLTAVEEPLKKVR